MRMTLLTLGTTAILFIALFHVESAEQEPIPPPAWSVQIVKLTTESPFASTAYPEGFAEQVAALEKDVKETNGVAFIARLVDAGGNPVKRVDYAVGSRFAALGFGSFPNSPQDGWFRTDNLLASNVAMERAVRDYTSHQVASGQFFYEVEINNPDNIFLFALYTAEHKPAVIKIPVMFGKVYYADIKLEKTPENELINLSRRVVVHDTDRPIAGATATLGGGRGSLVSLPEGETLQLPAGLGNSYRRTVTDAEGRFTFERVSPFHSARVSMSGYSSIAQPRPAVDQMEEEQDIRLYRMRDIEIEYVFQPDGSRDFTTGDLQPRTVILKSTDTNRGFRFETGDLSAVLTSPAPPVAEMRRDIDLRDISGNLLFRQINRLTAVGNGFYDVGEVPFESVAEASDNPRWYSIPPTESVPVNLNHVYVVKTLNGKYAKFIVRKIGPDLELESEEATQFTFTLPDGTETKDVIVSIAVNANLQERTLGTRQIAQLQPAADGTYRAPLSPAINLLSVRTRDGKFGVNRLIQGDERLQPVSFALEPAVPGTVKFVEKSTGTPLAAREISCMPLKAIPAELAGDTRWSIQSSRTAIRTDENGVAELTMYVGADYLVYYANVDTSPPRVFSIRLSPQTAGVAMDGGVVLVE